MEAFIDQLAVPLMLGFGALALVAALGGILGFLLAANKNRKAVYWWRISGGVSYLSLSAAGAVAVGYLSEGRLTTEICVVALKGLTALGTRGVTMDFALPRIVDDIFAATKTRQDGIDGLRHTLAGPVDKALSALDALALPEAACEYIARLRAVISGVEAAIAGLDMNGISLTIDPLETRGFEYHGGLAFTLFAADIRGELGRGGRYDIYEGDKPKESAAGFTLYMDTLRQGLKVQSGAEVKELSADADWAEVARLQAQGIIVKRG